MVRKVGLTIVVLLLFIACLGFLKFEQIQAAVKEHAFTPPPTAVTTIIAKNEAWVSTRKAVGTAVAVQGVTVSADLPGIVSRITFESGRQVHAGDVLVELDTRQ